MKIGTYRWGCKATSIMGELPVKPIREILTLQMAIGRTAQQSIKQMADFESGPLLESRQSRMAYRKSNWTIFLHCPTCCSKSWNPSTATLAADSRGTFLRSLLRIYWASMVGSLQSFAVEIIGRVKVEPWNLGSCWPCWPLRTSTGTVPIDFLVRV